MIYINGALVEVYCLMATEDDEHFFATGGYTVIQSRVDPAVSFERTFEQFQSYFGRATPAIGSYWIGLENLYNLTNQFNMRLNLRTVSCMGQETSGEYDSFRILDASKRYAVTTGIWSTNGSPCDGFKQPFLGARDEGCPFATLATYNPNFNTSLNCVARSLDTITPEINSGGWWFGSGKNNFNGHYYPDGDIIPTQPNCDIPSKNNTGPLNGIRWCANTGRNVYQQTVMALLPTND